MCEEWRSLTVVWWVLFCLLNRDYRFMIGILLRIGFAPRYAAFFIGKTNGNSRHDDYPVWGSQSRGTDSYIGMHKTMCDWCFMLVSFAVSVFLWVSVMSQWASAVFLPVILSVSDCCVLGLLYHRNALLIYYIYVYTCKLTKCSRIRFSQHFSEYITLLTVVSIECCREITFPLFCLFCAYFFNRSRKSVDEPCRNGKLIKTPYVSVNACVI